VIAGVVFKCQDIGELEDQDTIAKQLMTTSSKTLQKHHLPIKAENVHCCQLFSSFRIQNITDIMGLLQLLLRKI